MKILVVDDSALMRRALAEILGKIPNAEVKTARNGNEALEKVEEWQPDVVTLDVNMPVMDGLTCLSHIVSDSPRPVVMVSSITKENSTASLEALSMGAVDVIEKPDGTVSRRLEEIGENIRRSVVNASRARIRRQRKTRSAPVQTRGRAPKPSPIDGLRSSRSRGTNRIILIGVSTGGPSALESVLPGLPSDLGVPLVIAQHMPGNFTGSFAQRLDSVSNLRVVEATVPTPLEAGTAYIIHGGSDGVIERRLGRLVVCPVSVDRAFTWHPSVDRLVTSASQILPCDAILGVLLTGMGDDGAKSMAAVALGGGHTIAEAESSAVVFGMPRELIERGGAKEVCPIDSVAAQITRWAKKGS